jgi:hypothetical protein
MISAMQVQTLRVRAAGVGRVLRPMVPMFAMVIACLVIPDVVSAQSTMFAQVQNWLGSATKIVGGVLMIGGLLLLLAGGWGVKEGRGGWAPMAVGLVITYVGFQVWNAAGAGSMPSPSSIFG